MGKTGMEGGADAEEATGGKGYHRLCTDEEMPHATQGLAQTS